MIQWICGKCWLISMEGKCLCLKIGFLRFQCLILVSGFVCGISKDYACAHIYKSLKYEMFPVYFLFITWDFLILVLDLRNIILDIRIYMAHNPVQFFIFETKEENCKPFWILFRILVWSTKKSTDICLWLEKPKVLLQFYFTYSCH